MTVFDHLVVGVDGTDWGLEALRQALVLAPPSAAVHAVTALDTRLAVHAGFEMSHILQLLGEEAERARSEAAEMLKSRASWTASIGKGDAKAVLGVACREHNATLLALGGRSSSRFLGILTGETATALLHEPACSVLLARPHKSEAWHPRRIVVGVDGSDSSLAALSVADELAARLGSSVNVVSAEGGKLLDRDGIWTTRVDTRDPGHPVVALLDRSQKADLILIGSRGLHGVRALGSVSERTAHRAHCSVLVVHQPLAAGHE